MKNLLFLFFFFIAHYSCKKQQAPTPVNKLIAGLDPSVVLPSADTTGALAYIEGYIDGERFCLAEGKDSVQLTDAASSLFGNDYKKEWIIYGIGGNWTFGQPEQWEKRWYIDFQLPTFALGRDTSEFNAFKRKYAAPSVFTNLDACGKTIVALEQFRLDIFRKDTYDNHLRYLGIGTCGATDQTGSYIKLVSVGKIQYIPNTNYHYEMIYEFDLKLSGNRHLTKGRMRTWLMGLKL